MKYKGRGEHSVNELEKIVEDLESNLLSCTKIEFNEVVSIIDNIIMGWKEHNLKDSVIAAEVIIQGLKQKLMPTLLKKVGGLEK